MASNLGRFFSGIQLYFAVRQEAIFYCFIVEEAVQSLGMACYLLTKAEKYTLAAELANYAIESYCQPMIKMCSDVTTDNDSYNIGIVMMPTNSAFHSFFVASEKNFRMYADRVYETH